ncbi:transcriptional regulator TbsP [Salinarchaeum sp. IM2453]|uniref:transcriptional regulator TbsP n=1 Tax=Salinarchaeum sp. IM2453 TaxID=2862870 RepID=UPI0021068B66|nr:DUF5821 family protein [Salinarchaeum sp. IM2453]
MSSNLVDERLETIYKRAMDETEELITVTPTQKSIETLINVTISYNRELPDIKLLAERQPLKRTMDDFITASHAADLVDQGTLSIRGKDQSVGNNLIITEKRVITVVDTQDYYAGLIGESDELVEAAVETYRSRWKTAGKHQLRTPPISEVKETLAEEINKQVKQDFVQMLDRAEENGREVDEVTLALLAAARNEELLYNISRWGENVGIASKATFSRTKTKLEDRGLIETEKVPIDVGRPRLRLKLNRNLSENEEGKDQQLVNTIRAELV